MRPAVLLMLLLLANPFVKACTCDYGPVPRCQQLRSHSGGTMLVGTVESIRYRNVKLSGGLLKEQLVVFNVEDAFRGVHDKRVEVRSFVSPGMCGYVFKKGLKYFVDAVYSVEANGAQGSLEVSSCGLTTTAERAADEIRFLRTLRQHPDGAIVFGTVKQYARGSTFVSLNNRPIQGTTVALEEPRNGFLHTEKREVAADSTGWYQFTDLSAGLYTVIVKVPAGFTGVFQHDVEVSIDGCAQVDVRAYGAEHDPPATNQAR